MRFSIVFSLLNTNYLAIVVLHEKTKCPFTEEQAPADGLLTTKLKGCALVAVRKEQSQSSVPGQASKGHARTTRNQTSLSSQVLACRHVS